MPLIPAVELGLWNAWILVVAFFLIDAGLIPLIEGKLNYKESRPSRPTCDGKKEILTSILIDRLFSKRN